MAETRKQMMSYVNLNKMMFSGVGEYQVPEIQPTSFDECEFVGFNYAKTTKHKNDTGLHFFLDDYQFERLWNNPDKYLQLLSQFKYIMTPDFSTYNDFPKAVQIYNHFRKHWLGAYWQLFGINVIPTISWSNERSFEWCFDGEPTNSVVAVSSVGTQSSKESKRSFLNGYNEMMERLSPTQVIFYGDVPEECSGNIIRIRPFQKKFEGAKQYGR